MLRFPFSRDCSTLRPNPAELVKEPPLSVRDLVISGEDVIALMRELGLVGQGFQGDARVGEVLRLCLEQVLDDPQSNDRAVLLSLVRKHLSSAGS